MTRQSDNPKDNSALEQVKRFAAYCKEMAKHRTGGERARWLTDFRINKTAEEFVDNYQGFQEGKYYKEPKTALHFERAIRQNICYLMDVFIGSKDSKLSTEQKAEYRQELKSLLETLDDVGIIVTKAHNEDELLPEVSETGLFIDLARRERDDDNQRSL